MFNKVVHCFMCKPIRILPKSKGNFRNSSRKSRTNNNVKTGERTIITLSDFNDDRMFGGGCVAVRLLFHVLSFDFFLFSFLIFFEFANQIWWINQVVQWNLIIIIILHFIFCNKLQFALQKQNEWILRVLPRKLVNTELHWNFENKF